VAASAEEMDGGTCGFHCKIQYGDELGLDIKTFLPERNGAASGVDAEVSP
jgi:hypothetical protein